MLLPRVFLKDVRELKSCCVILFFLSGIVPGNAQTRDSSSSVDALRQTWMSDNGDGTFTNPLFYDEFSDPDLIRVGDDYYMTGTTMHAMPGLPVLHSKDLVNWEFLTYAVNKLDFGPAYRLEKGKDIYGQGIWAPCLRYHNGTFYIFTNVNRQTTQLFTATDPRGPWKQTAMKKSFHDLSVLFDDDGKIYVVWGYDEIHLAELTDDLIDTKPGTEKIIVPKGSGAGEGCHFYKIDGRYFITNTNYDPVCYQVCLRADQPTGPYEVNVISAEEGFGVGTSWQLRDYKDGPPFPLIPPVKNRVGCITLHQGGVVKTQTGEWWAWSMMDHNSVGRLTALSPVTWENGWPYLGLPGNLTRSPRTWVKPNTGFSSKPMRTYERSDDFSVATLKPIWQWNHVPVDKKWSLSKRKGYLRLYALPANDFWSARNTLTQRAIGPESIATTEIDLSGLKDGDVVGLALLNFPYAWIGVVKEGKNIRLQQFDQQINKPVSEPLTVSRLWLRVHCDFYSDKAMFSYSTDGSNFKTMGDSVIMPFQLRTFQGVRFSLFNFNTGGRDGGYADFNNFNVEEPSKSLVRIIPHGDVITLRSLADSTVLVNWKGFLRPVPASSPFAEGSASHFRVLHRGNGRIALQSLADNGFVTVKGEGGMAEVRIEQTESGNTSLFQWEDMLQSDLMLMSLVTHRYLSVDPHAGSLTSANSPGPQPDHKGGSCFMWYIVEE